MAVPTAPTLRALGTGQGSVRVSLDPVADAESYVLWRSTDAAFSDEAVLTTDPELRPEWYFDVTALEGFTHWYRATTLGEAADIVSSSIANPTVVTTTLPHGLTTGDNVIIAGHTSVTPDINGRRVVTVISPTTFSVPVNVSDDGVGGTFTPESVKSAEKHVTVTSNWGGLEPTAALRYERANR